VTLSLASETAKACHTCKQNPCVLAPPEPSYECVIENVPVTVMKTKTKVDLVPVKSKTIMETRLETTYVDEKRTICWPTFETKMETRHYTVCKPVYETTMVPQQFMVGRPVTTTRQVTEYCLKPFTEQVTVPVKTKCGSCGHPGGGCTCRTLARTCYRLVPVVREVTETTMVSEVQTQMVPVVHCRMVPEQRSEQVPVVTRKMKTEDIHFKVPMITSKRVPKTLVWKTAVVSCVEVPVTVYRPVMKMVPVYPCDVEASPQAVPAPQTQASPFREEPALPPPGPKPVPPEGTSPEKPK
jgi:hypothetical protein